jgi:hypothetical protein
MRDRARCAFWLPMGALDMAMRILFSHATNVDVSVVRNGLDPALVPHLTATGTRKRGVLAEILASSL